MEKVNLVKTVNAAATIWCNIVCIKIQWQKKVFEKT